MIYWDLEQRTEEWHKLRLGKVTASSVAKILPGKSGYTRERENYKAQLACEILTGKPADFYCSPEMQRGIDLEPVAREEYEMRKGSVIYCPGFIDHPEIKNFGCSPDGLNGKPDFTKGIEIKCMKTANHIDAIESIISKGKMDPNYYAQIQASMICAGVKQWDYVLYDDRLPPGLSLFVYTIDYDISAGQQIIAEVNKFNVELVGYINKLKELEGVINE